MVNQSGVQILNLCITASTIASDRKQDEHCYIKMTPEGTDEMECKKEYYYWNRVHCGAVMTDSL